MGWKQYARAAEAGARRRQRAAEREALRRHREMQKMQVKAAERERAAAEAARFENYLELITSLHKECGDAWDWNAVSTAEPPNAPQPTNRREQASLQALQNYNPGFFERLFGEEKRHRATLQQNIEQARSADRSEYEAAYRDFHAAWTEWSFLRSIAPQVIARDPAVYAQTLEHVGAFDEVSSFQNRVVLADVQADVITFTCEIADADVVPREELKLTSTGKLTTKAMPAGRYWALFQDHVCSCALRIANETFAVLPVSRAIVNVGSIQVNPSTGHREMTTFLGVHITGNVLRKLNLANVDPSDSMKNFPHRMKFKKTAGFDPVPPITTDEHWVTT